MKAMSVLMMASLIGASSEHRTGVFGGRDQKKTQYEKRKKKRKRQKSARKANRK